MEYHYRMVVRHWKYWDWATVASTTLCVGTIVFYWPGLLNPDPIDQYRQALVGKFNADHPPIMAMVWRVLLGFGHGAGPMLVFHNVIFFSGICLIARALCRTSISRLVFLMGISLFPVVFVQLGMIWKDTGVAVSLVLATGLLLSAEKSPNRWGLGVLALVALFYASAVRHNSLLAVVPYCFWMVSILGRKKLDSLTALKAVLVKAAGGILIAGILAGGVQVLNRTIAEPRPSLFFFTVVGDTTAISIHAGRDLRPSFLQAKEGVRYDKFVDLYADPYSVANNPTYWRPADASEAEQMLEAWAEAIRHYPLAYLQYRAALFADAIGLSPRSQVFPYVSSEWPNDLGLKFEGHAATRLFFEFLDAYKHGPLFRGYLYLILCLVVYFACAMRFLRSASTAVVSASGVLYACSYFVCTPNNDFRYLYWCVTAGLLSAAFGAEECARSYFARRTIAKGSFGMSRKRLANSSCLMTHFC